MKHLLAFTLLLHLSTIASAQSVHDGQITQSFVEPIERSIVASAVPGVIQEAKVSEGDQVSSGDLLAVISHKVLLAEKKMSLARSESPEKLNAATVRLQIQKQRKETLESLIESGHVNQFELDEKKAEYEQALAEFRAAKKDMELAKLDVERIDAKINDHIIRSPINGFVTEVHKHPGEFVSANQPQFATVMRLDELKVKFYLDESTLARLDIGTKVQLLVGESRKPVEGTVYFVSPIIDADSFTGRVYVRINNKDLGIRSGSVCRWQSVKDRLTESRTTTQR